MAELEQIPDTNIAIITAIRAVCPWPGPFYYETPWQLSVVNIF